MSSQPEDSMLPGGSEHSRRSLPGSTYSFVVPDDCLKGDDPDRFMMDFTKHADSSTTFKRKGSVVTIRSPHTIDERTFEEMPDKVPGSVAAFSMMRPDGSRKECVATWEGKTGKISVYPNVSLFEHRDPRGNQCLLFNPTDRSDRAWPTKATHLGHVTHAEPSNKCSVWTFRPLDRNERRRLKQLRAQPVATEYEGM